MLFNGNAKISGQAKQAPISMVSNEGGSTTKGMKTVVLTTGQNGVKFNAHNSVEANETVQNKAAKSVSSSKPPAHAQYFNSAKIKTNEPEGAPSAHLGGHADQNHQMQQPSTADDTSSNVQTNRTAITTGNGKTQIEIQGNQMLCLWNVNIGSGG